MDRAKKIRKIFEKLQTNTTVLSVLLGCLFTFFVLTGQWAQYGSEQSAGVYVIQGVILFAVYYGICLFLFRQRDKVCSGKKHYTERKLDFIWREKVSPGKEFLIVFVCFVILYLPAFLAVFPGIFGYDGPVQIEQFFSSERPITAHHPLAHTILLGVCFSVGNFFFHDYNAGLALYTILQNLIMSFAFSYAIYWMRKRGAIFWGRLLALLFFATNPIIQLMNCNTTKDTLFSGFFLLVFIFYIDILRNWSKKGALKFMVASILMCLFRNQGYYLLLFCFIILLLTCRKKKVNVCKVVLLSAIIGWFCMSPLISLLQIEKGDPREMLSLPMQQMAAVWKQDEMGETVLDPKDKQKLEELISVDGLEQFQEDSADPVKSAFSTAVLKEDLLGYARLYLKIGIDHTKSYIDTFFKLSSRYWDPYQYGNYRGLMYSNVFPEINICGIERTPILPSYYQYLEDMTNCISRLPVIRLIFSQALPVWLMFFLFAVALRERNSEIGNALILLLGQWGILLLSPAFLIRYTLPLIVCVPVLVMLVFSPNLFRRKENSDKINLKEK